MIRIFLSLALLLGLSACGTVYGAGQDISTGGEALSDAAEDAAT